MKANDKQRWISRDPIGEKGGINLYAYCKNDSVNNADPSGLFAMCMSLRPKRDCQAELQDCQTRANEQFIVGAAQARRNRDKILDYWDSAGKRQVTACESKYGVGSIGAFVCDAAANAATAALDSRVWIAYNIRTSLLRTMLNNSLSQCDLNYLQCMKDNASQ